MVEPIDASPHHHRAEEVVATIRENGGKADFLTTGLADEASARELARRATELGGGHIDILVKAPFFLVSALAPQMAERGKGAIDSATLSTSSPPPRRTAALGCPRRSRPR